MSMAEDQTFNLATRDFLRPQVEIITIHPADSSEAALQTTCESVNLLSKEGCDIQHFLLPYSNEQEAFEAYKNLSRHTNRANWLVLLDAGDTIRTDAIQQMLSHSPEKYDTFLDLQKGVLSSPIDLIRQPTKALGFCAFRPQLFSSHACLSLARRAGLDYLRPWLMTVMAARTSTAVLQRQLVFPAAKGRQETVSASAREAYARTALPAAHLRRYLTPVWI